MNWPKSLIIELAARRCVIFLGSGASAGCISQKNDVSLPTWKNFLENLLDDNISHKHKNTISELINKEKYLDAAEVILNRSSPADFSQKIREIFVHPRFKASSIHEAILKIDPKIVVTTNYDDIYEKYCQKGEARDGYNVVKYYDGNLASLLRSPVRLIIKVHGCVTDPSKIVLTRSQYFRARQQFLEFYELLNAIFMTNTLLFIGYSISDPDIQLILENSHIYSASEHPHYALVEDNLIRDIEDAMKKAYNIHFLKFPTGDYKIAHEMIQNLANAVTCYREMNPSY